MSEQLSDYEKQRLENIAHDQEVLAALGLGSVQKQRRRRFSVRVSLFLHVECERAR